MSPDWHANDEDLSALASASLSGAAAASLEAHLLACHRCRVAMASLTGAAGLPGGSRQERMWSEIADTIDEPSVWNRVGAGWLRLTVGSPTLRWATAGLVLALLALPLLATTTSGRAGALLLLTLAPLGPLAGAVLAYRPECDPAGTMAGATPMASHHLVFVRTLVVIAAALPLGLLSSLLLPARLGLLLGWLLPGLALCAVVLAVGTRVEPTPVAIGLAVLWAASVLAGSGAPRGVPVDAALEQLFVNQPLTQGVSGTVAVVAGAVFMTRRHAAEPWGQS